METSPLGVGVRLGTIVMCGYDTVVDHSIDGCSNM